MSATNRLGEAASPYLLQHASNPVHWQEWGPEAFAAAQERQVPVLLSVGYATCHWCHVMAHESFEDPAIADLMNRWFVNIKVDREERPDVDRIYMDAVQMMTGRGGWPMTVFLTPDAEPFYAGTYYPPDDRPGHPSFRRVLTAIHEAWEDRRGDLEEQGRRLAGSIAVVPSAAAHLPDSAALATAYDQIAARFDSRFGGFGGAPKFPQAPTLEFLLRIAGESWAPRAGEMVAATLRAMAGGGIRDHVGGGFARYSVDVAWTVPHFEKMLYDNAQLLRLYAHAAGVVGDAALGAVATEIARYLLRDLRLPGGGFASGEDADSEGAEGTFYVFSREEVATAAQGSQNVVATLGVTAEGNFEGANVLTRRDWTAESPGMRQSVEATLAELERIRSDRPRPQRDDKVIAAWNGLAIRALAESAVALEDPTLLQASIDAAGFVLENLRDGSGRLHRSWRAGRLGPEGFCDDYAAMSLACLALYQTTGDENWFVEGAEFGRQMVARFADPHGPGFFATAHDAEPLIARPQNLFDLPTPSDNALAAEVLLHLAAFTGEAEWWDRLDQALRLGAGFGSGHPEGAAHHLAVLHTRLGPPREVAIVGPTPGPLLAVVHAIYRPGVFVARADGSGVSAVPLLSNRVPDPPGTTSAFVCRGFVCDLPTSDPEVLRRLLS